MIKLCALTIAVDRKAVPGEDWRDDDRWDQLVAYADGLFPGFDIYASGSLVDPGDV